MSAPITWNQRVRNLSLALGRSPSLAELLTASQVHIMTPEEEEAQRQSWLRGNDHTLRTWGTGLRAMPGLSAGAPAMKTAREIIARAAWECQRRKLPHFDDHADAILAALAAEGFSIVETGPERIDLPARERRAFDKMMERPGTIVTSEALISAIWPDADGGPENAADVLSHVICRLRAGLGKGLRITTHRNLGYSIDAPARSTREGKTG